MHSTPNSRPPAVDTGKLGNGGLTIEQGQASARVCVLNALTHIKNALGSLEEVSRVVKVCVFVASKEGALDSTLLCVACYSVSAHV